MILFLAIFGSTVFYLAGYIGTARRIYAKNRPSRVPVCKRTGDPDHFHRSSSNTLTGCYGYYTDREAIGKSLTCSLAWPAVALASGLVKLVTMNQPSTAAERKADLAQAERDLLDMNRQLDEARREAGREHGTFETK